MISRDHKLPVTQQCQILELSRSTAYCQPRPVSDVGLILMCRIDELYLEHTFASAKLLRDMLRREGHKVGHKHVATLMECISIAAAQEAMAKYGKPGILDAGKGCWRDDVFVEHLWKSINYEEVYLHAYDTVNAAKQGLVCHLILYNRRRLHSVLDKHQISSTLKTCPSATRSPGRN